MNVAAVSMVAGTDVVQDWDVNSGVHSVMEAAYL